MLGEIRNYLRRRGTASLREIAIHLDTPPEAAQLALDYWMKKGKVTIVHPACDTGCTGCPGDKEPLYRWVERERPVRFVIRDS